VISRTGHRSTEAANVGHNLSKAPEHDLKVHIVERIGDGEPRQLRKFFATTSSDTRMALLL